MKSNYKIVTGSENIQGSQEWLTFRKGKISASIAPSIMDVGFMSRLDLWESIVFDKKTVQNDAMRRGIEMEPEARNWINKKLGSRYEPVVVQSLNHPNFIASLDGYYEDDDGVHILEIKCAGPVDHALALSERIPPKYYPQLQHQMDLCGVDSMLYLSYSNGEGVIVKVQRDEEYCQKLFSEELSFLGSLINMVPPKPTDRDWIDLNNPEMIKILKEYDEICEAVGNLEEQKNDIKKNIICELEHPRVKIGKHKFQKINRKGDIDYATMVESLGLTHEAEKYRKTSSQFWKVSY